MRSFVLVAVVVATIVVTVIAMRGQGHDLVRRWLPSIHGGRGH
jgi:hypothetical protein